LSESIAAIHAKINIEMQMKNTTRSVEAKRERNPLAHARHRKEALWQISVPLVLGSLALLVFAGLSFTLGGGETSRWADISIIWLITPVMLVTLFTFVTLAASIYATVKLIQVLPRYSLRLLNGLILIGRYVHQAEDRAVEPVLRLKSFEASARALGRQIVRK